jgi:hypothetical protein
MPESISYRLHAKTMTLSGDEQLHILPTP